MKNIHMRNITAGNLNDGILGIETDVLYQWRDLVPTYEERSTLIRDICIQDIEVGSIDYITRISGTEALPIENVSLVNVNAETVRGEPYENRNVEEFDYQTQGR